MTLQFESGDLVIRDGAGTLKFSSAENLFTVTDFVDSRVVGAVSLPSRTATATSTAAAYINTSTDYFIANVNAAADIVFGMVQAGPAGSGTDNSRINTRWRQVNGTNIYTWWATAVQGQPAVDRNFASSLGLFTFYITSGQLYMRDRLIMRAYAPTSGSRNAVVPAFTMNFRLYCGTFI